MSERTIAQALNEALDAALGEPDVVLMGEDVAQTGGVFRISDGLLDKHGPDLFEGIPPHAWMGTRSNVYCVDFSVGGRYVERAEGLTSFQCRLAALRVPEWVVMHDDGESWDIGPPG